MNEVRIKRELEERVLEDDYPVHGDYLYVADGRVIRSPIFYGTIRQLKQAVNAKEIKSCDPFGRGLM